MLPVGSSASTTAVVGRERPRDGDPLALPARELRWAVMVAVTDTHAIEEVPSTFATALTRPVVEHQGERDVLERIRTREEVEGLEDKPDLSTSERGTFVVGGGGDVVAGDLNGSFRGCVECTHEVHQRALTRPARSHNRSVRSRGEREKYICTAGNGC